MALPYFICGTQEVMSGMLRGMGASMISMIVSLVGCCLFRVIWIYTAFVEWHSLETLYLTYPISWIIVTVVDLVCFSLLLRRRSKARLEVAYDV